MSNKKLPYKITGKTFLGRKISPYGLKNGFVDYRTLGSCFDKIQCNEILNYDDNWSVDSGSEEEAENICQIYLIDGYGAWILRDWTNELVYYNRKLDLYAWAVTHDGTGWDYVLTDIHVGSDSE